MPDAFALAHAEFLRCRSLEDDVFGEDDAAQVSFDAAVDATTDALREMLVIPARDMSEALTKVRAIILLYDAERVPHLVEAIAEVERIAEREMVNV